MGSVSTVDGWGILADIVSEVSKWRFGCVLKAHRQSHEQPMK